MGSAKNYVMVVTVLTACGLLAAPLSAKTQVKFRTVGGVLIKVPVYVNAHGPYDFILDTGTNNTLIDTALAAQLGLKADGQQELATLTGSQVVSAYRLDSVSLGSESVSGLRVLGQQMTEADTIDSRIRGVLGLDFLARFAFSLDYRHHRIELYSPWEVPDFHFGTRVLIQLISDRLLVSTATESSTEGAWRLALDSGIAQLAVFKNRIRQPQDANRGVTAAVQLLTNLSGTSTAIIHAQELAIAALHLRNVNVVVLPTNPMIQRGMEDGLLPTSMFQYILVNAKEGYGIFEPAKGSSASYLQ
jgi:hypothetical protein